MIILVTAVHYNQSVWEVSSHRWEVDDTCLKGVEAVAFHFHTGVCSNCCKLLGEAENKTAAQLPGIESEVVMEMGDMSLVTVVSVNDFQYWFIN